MRVPAFPVSSRFAADPADTEPTLGHSRPPIPLSEATTLGKPAATVSSFFSQPSAGLYWLCQAAGWSVYTAICYLSFRAQRGDSPTYLATYLAFGAEGWLLTHLYRDFLSWRRWLRLPLGALLPRVVAATLLLAAVLNALIYVNVRVAARLAPPAARPVVVPRSAAFLLGQFADNTFVIALWSTIYFGVGLAARSRRAETERWRLAAALAEAELRGLRAQVNPHFLFNALNTVRALISDDPAQAQEAVTRLAAILRHALRRGETSPLVPLVEELEIVDDYLALELLRFGDRLRVERDFDPSAFGTPVPPLIVQGLVENAIKHGVSRERGPATLRLRVACDKGNGQVEIAVTNGGRLFAQNADCGSPGVGLANAHERLARLFGEAASLELSETPPGSVTATLRLPLLKVAIHHA